MKAVITALKNRKIVQWTIAYSAGAWALLQVYDLVAAQFSWPVWTRQAATVLVLFGLLITIVIAWYHGEKGRQQVGAIEVVLLLVLLVVGGQSVLLLRERSISAPDATAVTSSEFRSMPLAENSVAVLPCVNLSADESHSYFADALAAELITRLSAIDGLRIPSHTSSFAFKNNSIALEAIAASLHVRHVLECDVSGDQSRVKINTRLVDAQTGYALWTDSYSRSRDNLFDVQQEVALAIVEKLDITLDNNERVLVNRQWTKNREAYDEFLRGIRFQISAPTPENVARARQHLERAVELDPEFGRAYARLALHWIVVGNFNLEAPPEAYAEAERLALHAIELDEDLFEAYWSLGWAKFAGKYDWQGAAEDFRRVIDLAPGEWGGYHSLGFVQGVLGNISEAIQAARIAIDLDPLAHWPRTGLEVLYVRQRDYEAAARVVADGAEIQGWYPESHLRTAYLLAMAGQQQAARERLAIVAAQSPEGPDAQLMMAMTLAALGDDQKALTIAEAVEEKWVHPGSYRFAGALATIYSKLGDSDRAMRWLQRSRENRDLIILFLDLEAFDGLRGDPRFIKLVRALGLPEQVYLDPDGQAHR